MTFVTVVIFYNEYNMCISNKHNKGVYHMERFIFIPALAIFAYWLINTVVPFFAQFGHTLTSLVK